MLFAWLMMFFIGVYSIYYGQVFQHKQLATIHQIDTAYQARIQLQLKNFVLDTTVNENKSRYKNSHDPFMNEWFTRPMVWKKPKPLQALAIGQSDNQSFFYNIWIYNNVYNNKLIEVRNPSKLQAGNFDLAFVFIYLMPLLLIAYCYNVLSAEKENGLYKLLSVQYNSPRRIIFYKIIFRGWLVGFLILLLSFIGLFVVRASFEDSLLWTAVSLMYLFFWLAVINIIIAFSWNSSLNALLLISSWVLFLLVIPSLVAKYQDSDDSVRLQLADADREYGSALWSMENNKIIDTLFLVKPEWRIHSVKDSAEAKNVAYAYLDMLNMNRVGSNMDVYSLEKQEKLEMLNCINPTFSTQLLFNRLAGSEVHDFIRFRKASSDYQLLRSEIIHSFRLSDKPYTSSDYSAYPPFENYYKYDNMDKYWWRSGFVPLAGLIILFMIIGRVIWKKCSSVL